MASRILSCLFDFEFQILLELGMKFWKLSWSLEDKSLVSWEVWGFWVVLEWDARLVCEFELIMMVFFFFLNAIGCEVCVGWWCEHKFQFLRCKGKYLFLEWCVHWVVVLWSYFEWFSGVRCLLELVGNVFFLMNGCKNQVIHELKFLSFGFCFCLEACLGSLFA